MPGTRNRPNANPILDMMRDGDTADMWGLTMSWGFAICDVLFDADPNEVPAELQYRPAMAGPEVPSGSDEPEMRRFALKDVPYEIAQVWEFLHQTEAPYADNLSYWDDPTFAGRVTELRFAGRCLHRYADWLRAAGKDY